VEDGRAQVAHISVEELKDRVVGALKEIYDPEIPVDIYELGLIYDIALDEEGRVGIQMTLTAPACPVAGSMPGMVKSAVEQVREVRSCQVEMVWEPSGRWSACRMLPSSSWDSCRSRSSIERTVSISVAGKPD
jgi:FeS assembly SUF system protein